MNAETLTGCHQRAVATSAQMRLPLRARVWKGQAGEFLGAGSGSSLDFQDHRSYAPGDDPRHINWAAFARTGHYTMKLYREEVRPVVDVILDASESMFFLPEKAVRVAELLGLMVESARRAGAAVAVHLVRGDAVRTIEAESVSSGRWFDEAGALKAHDAATPPALQMVPLRANAIRVFLSDLLFPGSPEPMLQLLAARQGAPLIFSPFLEGEARPAWTGNYEFVDAERQTRHPQRVEASTLKRYLEAYAQHFSLWKEASNRHQAKLARVPCEPDLAAALFADAVPAGALELH